MKFTIENSLYTSGSLAGKAGHPLVFPMVKETIKFLDKKLGYKEKDKIHATVYDGKTFCDRYPHPRKRKDFLVVHKTDIGETRWRKRIPNEYVMETDSEQLTDYSGEVLIQVLALTWDKEEEPIALMYFFDNRCNSVWPKVDTDEERTTLYVYSEEFGDREKAPSVTIKNVGAHELGWWSRNCAYATSNAKLDSDKLPSNFKSLLTTFYKKLTYTGDGILKKDLSVMAPAWRTLANIARNAKEEEDNMASSLATDLNTKASNFNYALEELFKKHRWEGEDLDNKVHTGKFMIRDLFTDPQYMKSLIASHEDWQGMNYLEEIAEVEEDIKTFTSRVTKSIVTHFEASGKIAVCDVENRKVIDTSTRWYQNFDDFVESEDPLYVGKINVLDAAIDNETQRSPYISGVGFTIQQDEDGVLFGKTFRRIYILDSQYD
tara:strand:+ start:488 stop:1786 length:1299 start_codon:yes stop_codon:yes gene_type:complete